MKNEEKIIEFSKEDRDEIIDELKNYLDINFGFESGNLEVSIFLDFITDKIGHHYYNKGVYDSMVFMTEKADELYLIMKD